MITTQECETCTNPFSCEFYDAWLKEYGEVTFSFKNAYKLQEGINLAPKCWHELAGFGFKVVDETFEISKLKQVVLK